jgi:hypothetical protein
MTITTSPTAVTVRTISPVSISRGLAGRVTGEAMLAKYTGSRLHPTRDEIARLAYHFYVAGGRRDGHDLEDWLRAEQELLRHHR